MIDRIAPFRWTAGRLLWLLAFPDPVPCGRQDRVCPDTDPEFHDEVETGEPAGDDERFAITARGHVARMTAAVRIDMGSVSC
ncbi:hypothetical protein JHW45_12260 [Paracoccus stylophorae]|uniref:Secreted protein n=1 Tax=Paracoccus stylophorae TaxID=659350 RepID=A0ABY7SV55_9RHOB|nr:hypothetical protein JHW45_12260 [Paracoccus stylophorae]